METIITFLVKKGNENPYQKVSVLGEPPPAKVMVCFKVVVPTMTTSKKCINFIKQQKYRLYYRPLTETDLGEALDISLGHTK